MNTVLGLQTEAKSFNWQNVGGYTIHDIKKNCGDYCMAVQTKKIPSSQVIMNMVKAMIEVGSASIVAVRTHLGQAQTSYIPSYEFLCENAGEAFYTIFIFNTRVALERFELEVIDEMKEKIYKSTMTVRDKLVLKDKLVVNELPVDD